MNLTPSINGRNSTTMKKNRDKEETQKRTNEKLKTVFQEEKAKDRNQTLPATEAVVNGKSQGKITIPTGKFEAQNEITNFNDENGKFELSYSENYGTLTLKENGTELGYIKFEVRKKYIHLDSLISFRKGSGTELIRKLVEISEYLGKGGHIEAEASIYLHDPTTLKKTYRKQKTNLGFYYKLGFKAKNPERHKKIQEYLDKGEGIPLYLNVLTEIYLTDEGIQNLKNINNLKILENAG